MTSQAAEIARRLIEIDDERRATAARIRELDAQARALVEALAGGQEPNVETRWIDTSRAAQIAKRSYSWLYSSAAQFGFGHRLRTGSWTFDERLLRAFLAGQSTAPDAAAKSATPCDLCDGGRLPDQRDGGHDSSKDQGARP